VVRGPEAERAEPADEVWAIVAHTAQAPLAPKRQKGSVKVRSFLQVPDRKLDDSVAPVVCVEEDGVAHSVGDESVVAEGWEQRWLGIVKARAAHDEAMPVAIGGLGHPRLAGIGVVDRDPAASSIASIAL